ncbi:MAG: hypothetical protein GY777_06055 [Candidatus Brocadiaceae bacterium]|nr:hypothetical protein [Candidatus Brocadiaceae bacterium]
MNFDYGFHILEYHHFKTHSAKQNRVNRDWEGSASFNFENDFSILLSDRVNINRIPGIITRRTNSIVFDPVVPGSIDNESEVLEQFGLNTFTQPRQFTNNVASIKINLPDFFNKLDFILEYSNTDISYKQRSFGATNDRNKNSYKGMIKIKPLAKTEIATGFELLDIRYDKDSDRDSAYLRIPFDISWIASAKSYFFLNTSYNRRDYSGGSIYSNFTGYDAKLGYRFDVTERDNLLMKIEKSLVEQQFQLDPDIITRGDNNPQDWTQLNMTYAHNFQRDLLLISLQPFKNEVFENDRIYQIRVEVLLVNTKI